MKYFTCLFFILFAFFYSRISAQSVDYKNLKSNFSAVSRSIPFSIKRKQSKTFHFKESYKFGKPFKMTMEMTVNPIWFAIQALPYLIDDQNGSTEQLFNSFFANSTALYLLNKEVGLDALLAFWEKEPAGNPESEMHRRIGQMFDTVLINQRMSDEITKLEQLQLPDGSWPWFPGMKGSRYITQLICGGIGKLYGMHIYDKYYDRLNNIAVKAFKYCDEEMTNDYEDIIKKKENLKDDHLTPDIINYLYARTFWTVPIALKSERALYFWEQQGWNNNKSRSLLERATLVSAFYRQGEDTIYIKIFREIDKQAVHSDKIGVYWKENSGNTMEKIETQAMLLEGYNIMRFPAPETETLEGMKKWLLQWRQMDKWTTSTATLDAVYALLLHDDDSVITNNFPKITLGGAHFDTATGQGSGYWYHVWDKKTITPKLRTIRITSDSDTTAWVNITLQYNEKPDRVFPKVQGIKITKQVLFLKKETEPDWKPLSKETELKAGDSLKVNLVVNASKDIDYVHIQSPYDNITEQQADIAGVQIRDGLSIEKDYRNNSANFFIEKLMAGQYTFSYKLAVIEEGQFKNGKEVWVESVY